MDSIGEMRHMAETIVGAAFEVVQKQLGDMCEGHERFLRGREKARVENEVWRERSEWEEKLVALQKEHRKEIRRLKGRLNYWKKRARPLERNEQNG